MEIIINNEPVAIGTLIGGGFLSGAYKVGNDTYALATAPKALGQLEMPWSDNDDRVDGALHFSDGMANTIAMAAAGSELAAQVLALNINGECDWHIPAVDQLELMYRYLKPTGGANWLYGRAGINLSAVPPTFPYSADVPAQTSVGAFQAGGVEAFEPTWHYSSTQHAATSYDAWMQGFSDGAQGGYDQSYARLVRVVRRFKI